MNEILVPVDLTQEEKEILAVFSKRQFFIIFPPGVFILIFLLWGNIPFVRGFTDVLIRFIIFLCVAGTVLCLAYVRLDKHQQYLNEFVVTQWKFKRSQKTYTQF